MDWWHLLWSVLQPRAVVQLRFIDVVTKKPGHKRKKSQGCRSGMYASMLVATGYWDVPIVSGESWSIDPSTKEGSQLDTCLSLTFPSWMGHFLIQVRLVYRFLCLLYKLNKKRSHQKEKQQQQQIFKLISRHPKQIKNSVSRISLCIFSSPRCTFGGKLWRKKPPSLGRNEDVRMQKMLNI